MATDGMVDRWNSVAYNAVDERRLNSPLLMPGASTAPFSTRGGRRVNGSGLSVSVGGAPEAWTCTAGAGVIYDSTFSSQGGYPFEFPASVSGTMPARPGAGLSRIDLVVARIYDVDITVGAVREAKIELVTGTPAASPALPSAPPLSLILATLTVPNTGTISVVQSTARTVAAGGILPVATTAERDALKTAGIAYGGLVVDNAQTGALERYDGTNWKRVLDGVSDWIDLPRNSGFTGTVQYSQVGALTEVTVNLTGSFPVNATEICPAGSIPAAGCPKANRRGGLSTNGGFTGVVGVSAAGQVYVIHQSGATRTSVDGNVVYRPGS